MFEQTKSKPPKEFISEDDIERLMLTLRGERVLLSQQLATLYHMKVKAFNQTVKRNPRFFPDGSFFQLTMEEFRDIFLQIDTTSLQGSGRFLPYAFTFDAIIPLQYLMKRHGTDELNYTIFRAFLNKKRRLEALLG